MNNDENNNNNNNNKEDDILAGGVERVHAAFPSSIPFFSTWGSMGGRPKDDSIVFSPTGGANCT